MDKNFKVGKNSLKNILVTLQVTLHQSKNQNGIFKIGTNLQEKKFVIYPRNEKQSRNKIE